MLEMYFDFETCLIFRDVFDLIMVLVIFK